ncbi:hypothetical protein AAFF_G00432680 [Aldrovandia affinis]|uniref:Uncharacterized protein n=1 Tax=Aldrovandia affinis TaxID=143900 RepID=A0AAD7S8F0_9TELE|nr:hypothetical protein AAFF_G00432680 [Aldrovandia affinis]
MCSSSGSLQLARDSNPPSRGSSEGEEKRRRGAKIKKLTTRVPVPPPIPPSPQAATWRSWHPAGSHGAGGGTQGVGEGQGNRRPPVASRRCRTITPQLPCCTPNLPGPQGWWGIFQLTRAEEGLQPRSRIPRMERCQATGGAAAVGGSGGIPLEENGD